MRSSLCISFAAVMSFVVGCSDAPTATSQAPTTSSPGAPSQVIPNAAPAAGDQAGFVPVNPTKRYDDPRETVHDFLTAITVGDDKTATSLMSYAAQRETWSNGLALSSEGLPGTNFKITATEVVKPSVESHVETTWVDENNNAYPCVWLLKNEKNGWCIYGMATRYMENAPPVMLDFEDHEKLRQAQENAVRNMQQQMANRQSANRIGTQAPNGQSIQQVSGQQPLNR